MWKHLGATQIPRALAPVGRGLREGFLRSEMTGIPA